MVIFMVNWLLKLKNNKFNFWDWNNGMDSKKYF
jgi:hypothetical protein